jgi:cytochrome c oxidase subunit 2
MRRTIGGVCLSLLFASCSGHRDVLDPATREASQISGLWWIYFGVCLGVFIIVAGFVLGAISRARHQVAPTASEPQVLHSHDPRDRRSFAAVSTATIATVVIVFVLLVVDFSTGRTLLPPTTSKPLTVKITGHQWWWELEYQDPDHPAQTLRTANELHLPAGQPIELVLQSDDVIHSFWIPNLQGKKDLVPGHPTTLWLQPQRLGRFQGQCAEFCGYQHAHMGLLAVVESPKEFAKWKAAQLQSAPEPQTETQKRGRQVFLTTSCVLCHTIQGTPAGSHVGPPLTHLASQQMIAANSFPNTRGYLGGWIVDPQSLKPGVRMPQNALSPDDLNALLDYLETLK